MKTKRNKKKIQKAGSKTQTIQNTIVKPQRIWRLQLREVEDTFINFLKKNIHQLKGDHSNSFLERVYEYIISTPFYTNLLFENTSWLRLFNLFTEEVIYINERNEIEPLPYSWMELEVFGFKDLYGENEDQKIGEFMEFFFLQNYDLERNPFFIGEEWIFEKLHKFYEYKERKTEWGSIGKSRRLINQRGGKADVQRMIQLETLREDLDSVHNFMKTRTSSIPQSIPKSVAINMSRKDLLFKRSENEIKKIKPRLNVKSTITCKEGTNTYLSPRFNADVEKKETKKKVLKAFDINKYSSISTSSADKFFIRYYNKSNQIAHSQFEYYYLRFLMANDDIGSNVFYFSYNNLLSSNYFLFVKQLLYNAIGRFEILINDASFFKSIITDMLSNSKNKNEVKSFRKKIEIYLMYRKNLLFKKNIVITKKKWGELNTKYGVKNKNKKNTISEINTENINLKKKIDELNNEIQLWKDNIESLINEYLQTKDKVILDQIKVKLFDKKTILEKVKLKATFENLLELKQKLKFDIKTNNSSSGNYTYASWGMEIDPSSITGYHVPLFSKKIYEKMFLEIFADLQLNGCQFEFIINTEDNPTINSGVLLPELKNQKTQKIKSFTIKFTNPNILNQEKMNRGIDKSSPSSNRTAKDTRILQEVTFEINNDLNEVNFINNVIILLIDKLYKQKLHAFSSNKMNGMVNIGETSIPVSETDVKLQINKVGKEKRKVFKNFDKLIRILLNNQYTIQEITRFILRFKVMGDKLQGLEARYNCSILNEYSNQRMQFKEKDIYVKHRLMVTKDRPLMAFAQVENNINFLSQTTLNGEKVVYWNYGDAFSQMKDISDTDRQLDYLPVISTFTMNQLFGLNDSKIHLEIKRWRDIINQYFLFYKDQTSTHTVVLNPFTGLPKKTKTIPTKPDVTTSQQSSGTVVWRGTLPKTPKKFKFIIPKPTIPVS